MNKYSKTRKAYKAHFTSKLRIFPGDPTGSPDDFFLRNYLNLEGICEYGRNIGFC